MAVNEFEAMYGFVLPASTYDDSASPNSDNEDDQTLGTSDPDGLPHSVATSEELGKRKSRRPPSTAEKRATHNAVERARRESLNGRFMELASALPSMAQVKRPSKSVIVAKSLEYVYATEDRERSMREENARLRKEIEELRAKLGLPSTHTQPVAIASQRSPRVGDAPRERVGSFDDSTSSIFSTSPSASGNSFETSPMSNVSALASSNPAYSAVFGRSLIADPVTSKPDTSGPPATAIVNPAPISITGLPYMNIPAVHPMAFDNNYLMALSMQQQHVHQQHQQNAFNLAMSGGNASMNNWSAYNFGVHGMNHPVSSGMPEYGNPLVFA